MAYDKEKRKISSAAWYRANKGRHSAAVRKWAEKNKERVIEIEKNRRAKLRDKRNKESAYYRLKNPVKWREIKKEYRLKNPGKGLADCAKRRASLLRATPVWANKFFIEEIYDLAARRTKLKSGGVKWHVDHIVPLKSDLVCGLHVEHNLQVIPDKANVAKGNRSWPDMP